MNKYYIESINKAVEFIKDNLDKKISLDGISEASGLPKQHFQRIYTLFTGETVSESAARLKIERAANILSSDSSVTVSELAAVSGFKTRAEFSRKFKSMLSFSPSAWRERGIELLSEEPLTAEEAETTVSFISSEIRELEEFTIAYIKYTGAFAGDTALFIFLYNKLTAWAASRDLLAPECENVVVYHDPAEIGKDPRQKISLGLSVPKDTKGGRDIGRMQLRGGKYLICRYNLGEDEYPEAWEHTYRKLMPEMGLVPEDAPGFELYPAGQKSPDRHKNIVDICIPVRDIE